MDLITCAKSGKATFGLGNARMPNQPPHKKNNIALDRLLTCMLALLSQSPIVEIAWPTVTGSHDKALLAISAVKLISLLSLCASLWTFSLCFSSEQNWSDDASNSDRSSSDVGQRTKELLEDPFFLVVGVKAATMD